MQGFNLAQRKGLGHYLQKIVSRLSLLVNRFRLYLAVLS
jgi:hypothetical protein